MSARARRRAAERVAKKLVSSWGPEHAEAEAKKLAEELVVDWDALDWDLSYEVRPFHFCTHGVLDLKAQERCASRARPSLELTGFLNDDLHITERSWVSAMAVAEVRGVPVSNVLAHMHSSDVHAELARLGVDMSPDPGWITPCIMQDPTSWAPPPPPPDSVLLS